jgi:hypothetical protein
MRYAIVLTLVLALAAIELPAASASEIGAQAALVRVIKRERGYAPQRIWCDFDKRRGSRRYYTCGGNTARADGSYTIRATVVQRGHRYRVTSLRT